MRLFEIIIPKDSLGELHKLIETERIVDRWSDQIGDDRYSVHVLLKEDEEKEILEALEDKFEDYRLVIYPVEGTLPKVEKTEEDEKEEVSVSRFITLSKEELYQDIEDPVGLSINYILMMVLSSIVAGIGILKDSEAIIIGAMVIAPFLAPNMSLAFGTTLGDWPIIKKSIISGTVASAIGFVISICWGLIANEPGGVAPDLAMGWRDIALAAACGFAGALSVLSAQGSSMVGVMVAAALLPPLIRGGLLLGEGFYLASLNSFLIFATNIICLNITSIIVFYVAGIRPSKWWEQENAKKKTLRAIAFWCSALLLIVGVIVAFQMLGINLLEKVKESAE